VHAVGAASIEDAFAADDIEALILRVGVGARAATAAIGDDLVKQGEDVVGLLACGHGAPQVANLPVRGGIFGVRDYGS